NITLNFDADVDPTTVSPQTLGLHRSMGRTAWDFDVNGGTVTLLPGSFFAGEVVHLTISDGVRSTDGGVATPHQLRFTAGATAPPACARQWTDIGAGLTGASDSDVAWGDADGDGDLDILVLGSTGTSSQITHLYLNDGGTFTNALANLPGSSSGSVAWGDYDGDGDLDVLLIRESASRLYRNDGGIFTNSGVGLPGLLNADAAWGDYDNDGDVDWFVTNEIGSNVLFRNDGPTGN
ncbi:VCBS repeat-containing protein, partial [bacterium]|nr:VCBS repeat-containing protein [bacterium]